MYLVDDYKNLDDYADHVFDLCHPVGEIYIRYPGQFSPQDLYKRGTWENISDEYAGLFFRAEGGNANPFEGGGQEDKIRNIIGRIENVAHGKLHMISEGVFSHGLMSETGNATGSGPMNNVDFNANGGTTEDNPMAGHADGPEIRPVNTTIQIWKRTA